MQKRQEPALEPWNIKRSFHPRPCSSNSLSTSLSLRITSSLLSPRQHQFFQLPYKETEQTQCSLPSSCSPLLVLLSPSWLPPQSLLSQTFALLLQLPCLLLPNQTSLAMPSRISTRFGWRILYVMLSFLLVRLSLSCRLEITMD